MCRSQWPRGLRRRSAAACLLRSWVRIPPGAWMFVYCECCVLSGRGLWDELITRPEESYRLWCVVVCDLETWRMRRPWPALGRNATAKKKCPRRKEQNFGRVFLTLKYTDKTQKLNGYGYNGQRKVWSSGGSTHCTLSADSVPRVCPPLPCQITEILLPLQQ
jgi:hypothetical protein